MSIPTPTRRRLAWIAAPAVAVLFAAGCGDDESSDTPTTIELDTSSSTAGTATSDTDTDGLVGAGEQAQADLEQALRDAGLSNLASAVASVDLSEVLADKEFTVFAPNDDAFLALDSDDLQALLADPDQLLDVLSAHLVVGERLTADDLADAGTVDTRAGTPLTVTGDADSLTIGGAEVTTTEEVGDTGIIHVIDTVLLTGATS